jgi:hypothetical protein
MIVSEKLTPPQIQTLLFHLGIDAKGRADDSGWMTIKSPLRDEKKPSFGLNIKTGAWKDHSTGDSGDVVTLAERINRMETKEAIQWIEEQTDIVSTLYNPPKKREKKPAKFWNDENLDFIRAGMKRLSNENHPLLNQVKEYDCINVETLGKYGAGIVNQWDKEWLAFPYPSGCQLYRRENESKVIRSLKGSTPGAAFFGIKQTESKELLFIAKSPRECILLSQEFGDRADVIGLATGEQGNISKEQIEALRKQISGSNYTGIYIFMDCDTDTALETAQSFSDEIFKALQRKTKLVNIHESTGGTYKDVTDCIRAGMDETSFFAMVKDAESAKVQLMQSANGIDRIFDVKTAPAIPNDVYESLPDLLQTRCSLIEQPHRKDVFLVAALPVLAAHMPNVLAAHADGYYSPDLFTQIIADPGAGKGVAIKGKKLGDVLNKELIEQSKRGKENFEAMPDERKAELSPPKDRCLFIPANSSSRAIYDTLEANGGSGLLFESEIDTMLNATGQEWGNFSDITRKAFHHEALSINRKSEKFFIDNPRLSICITGTFDQFKAMFESAENGHFSRYALYTFDVPRKWQSHRPTKNSRALDDSINTASETLFRLWQTLNRRNKPLYVDLLDEQWQMIDDTFAEKMQIIDDLDLSKYLHASNNRAAVLALRMASMFAVLRAYETNPDKIEGAEYINPENADMVAALWLADTFIKHAIRLYNLLPNATDTDGKGERFTEFLKALPGEFSTADALGIGEALEIPERTVKYWLSNETRIKRKERGHYAKN